MIGQGATLIRLSNESVKIRLDQSSFKCNFIQDSNHYSLSYRAQEQNMSQYRINKQKTDSLKTTSHPEVEADKENHSQNYAKPDSSILKIRRQHAQHIKQIRAEHEAAMLDLKQVPITNQTTTIKAEFERKSLQSKYESLLKQKDEYIKMLEDCLNKPASASQSRELPHMHFSASDVALPRQQQVLSQKRQPNTIVLSQAGYAPKNHNQTLITPNLDDIAFKIDIDYRKRDCQPSLMASKDIHLSTNRLYPSYKISHNNSINEGEDEYLKAESQEASCRNTLLGLGQFGSESVAALNASTRQFNKKRSRSLFASEKNSRHQINPMQKPKVMMPELIEARTVYK